MSKSEKTANHKLHSPAAIDKSQIKYDGDGTIIQTTIDKVIRPEKIAKYFSIFMFNSRKNLAADECVFIPG